MKKYLFLFALALTGLCVSCGDDEPELDLGDVSNGLIPNVEGGIGLDGLDYECKTLSCSCGAQYEVYHKNTPESATQAVDAYTSIESYPEGISKSWKLILSYEGAKKAYPMRIGLLGPVEQDCMWTCGCGREFLMSRAQYKIH